MPAKTKTPAPEKLNPADSAPVARLSTGKDLRTVDIDGKRYELRSLADYGIGAQQRLNRDGRRFGALWNSEEDLTDDQQTELKFLLDRIFDGDEKVAALVNAPRTVRSKVNDADRAEIVLDFCFAPLRKLLAAAAEQQAQADMQTETENEEARESESIPTS
ncbi:MAG: hypothetical protein ACYCQK_01625 [Acidiferrobacteraceae bacterium]